MPLRQRQEIQEVLRGPLMTPVLSVVAVFAVMLVIFVLGQRYFIEGIATTGIKG